MLKRSVDVEIAPDGTVKLEAFGFQGTGCLDVTREFEQWLGGQVTREMKPEAGTVRVPAGATVKAGA